MASRAEVEQLVRSLAYGDEQAERLARRLYRAKARVYRDTLVDLSRRAGRERKRAMLSPEIRAALEDEARDHARQIIRTHNKRLAERAVKRHDLPADLLERDLREYVRERNRGRAALIARSEVATARLDALVSFFRENGLEPEFDFRGPPAKCETCRALKAGGPWSYEKVVEIGYPHLNCTHRWAARTRARVALREQGMRPGQISAGRGGVAGIVGGEPLLNRTGTQAASRALIDAL